MAVEAEFPMTMWAAFLGMAVIYALVLVSLFRGMKSRGAVCCFAGQYALTWVAFRCLNRIVIYGRSDADITLNMILCGISWGLSIVLMLLGCWLLVKKKEEDHGTV